MAFKRRKARSRDPFEHLSRERDSAEEEMPWFLAPELQESEEDLNVQAGISSNISQEDLTAPVVPMEAEPPESYPAPAATEDAGQTAVTDLAEADHQALADIAEANHASVAGLSQPPFEPNTIDQPPFEPFPADMAPAEQAPGQHVPIEQLQEEPYLPEEHTPQTPVPENDNEPGLYATDDVGSDWAEPNQPQPQAVPTQDWTEPARTIEPPPDPGSFPPPAPSLEEPSEARPPSQEPPPPPVHAPAPPMPEPEAMLVPEPMPEPEAMLVPEPMPEPEAMLVPDEPKHMPAPTDDGQNVMQDPGFQSLFPEIPDLDGEMAEDDLAEPPAPDDNQRRELTTSFLNVLMNQDAGAQPARGPANGQQHGGPQLTPSYDEGHDQPSSQPEAQGPVTPRRPRRKVSRPRGYEDVS